MVDTPVRRRRSRKTGAVTIKDVAREAEVSTATVSRVFAGKDPVADDLAQRVREVAERLNYRPNPVAQSLRARTSRLIGVIVPDLDTPFFSTALAGIEEAIESAGYSMVLANCRGVPERLAGFLESMRNEAVAGVLIAPGAELPGDLEAMCGVGIPVCSLARRAPNANLDTVTAAEYEATRMAVNHLVRLGYERIGLLAGRQGSARTEERVAGYEDALGAARLLVDRDLIVTGSQTQEDAELSMQRMLFLHKKPTAVVLATYEATIGGISALRRANVDIPRQMAVIGYGEVDWAATMQPPLTVIAPPAREMGNLAARVLLERVAGTAREIRHITLPVRLIVRGSCGEYLPREFRGQRP